MRPEHPDRLTSQHELARAYLAVKEVEKATAMLESVVEIRKKVLKEGHPYRVDSIYELALCYYRARKYERALELAKSIENVARNRQGDPVADNNIELIDFILEAMEDENAI